MMQRIDTTWADVKVGDMMFIGLVMKVGEIRKTRSGRALISVTYSNGQTVYKDPEMECTLRRDID